MTSKLSRALAAAKAENRAALIGYLPAGFPTVAGGIEAVRALVEGGCDVVEVGLPHSDPVLDGPTIQTADDIALRGGVRIKDVLHTVAEVSAATGAPVLVMTYWNPVDRYGVARFAADLAAAGGAGCILPDLPVEESEEWRKAAGEHGLDTVFVVAPSSTDRRLAEVTAAGSGFVYAAAVMGVTGTRAQVGDLAEDLVARTRATTDLPVCVGLGVSTAAQATEVAGFADGVIVGSAFVQRILDAGGDQEAALAAVRSLAGELARGVRRGGERPDGPPGPGDPAGRRRTPAGERRQDGTAASAARASWRSPARSTSRRRTPGPPGGRSPSSFLWTNCAAS